MDPAEQLWDFKTTTMKKINLKKLVIGVGILLLGLLVFIIIEYKVFKSNTKNAKPDSTIVKPVVQVR